MTTEPAATDAQLTGARAADVRSTDGERAAPPARGVRRPWRDVPPWLRDEVGKRLGSPVSAAEDCAGGFSPGVAARLWLVDGRSVFAKAASSTPNPDTPRIHRREATIAAALPAAVPAPRLLDTIDADDWIILLYEYVDGVMPAQPWRRGELGRVLDLFTELARLLTPPPLAAAELPDAGAGPVSGWAGLTERHERGEDDLTGLPTWVRHRLADFAAAERDALTATAGNTLTHGDIRADNVLLTADRVVAVDWPWARPRAPWFDLLAFLPSVRMHGGPDPAEVFAAHPVTARADADAVTTALIGMAGFFIGNGRLPAPPGLPTLREFQLAQGRIVLDWLSDRIGPR